MMLRTLVPPLWSFVLLVLFAIGPCTGTLALWLRLRINPAHAKGITARPMMRTSLLPKVPTRALTPKINNATQSVVLNPMLPANADIVLKSAQRPLYLQKQTWKLGRVMSALCQKRTLRTSLFDHLVHLVGAVEHR